MKNKKPKGYWSKERCVEDALNYSTKTEWCKNSSSYQIACKNLWLDECCTHMKELQKPNGYWTLEKCKKEALKYNTKVEWRKKHSLSYGASKRNKWIEECCIHMSTTRKPDGYWSKERCVEDALNYTNKGEWFKKSQSAYGAAQKNEWLDECCSHMCELQKPKCYWSKERCLEDALNYNTKSEWKKKSSGYSTSLRNNWIDECCGHMEEINRPNGYWKKERCVEDALKYKTKNEWSKNSSGYGAAQRNGWVNECCGHMEETNRPKGYWTKERCVEDALKYKTKSEWIKQSPSAYDSAHKNEWIDECCNHMDILWCKKWDIHSCKNDALNYKTRSSWGNGSPGAYDAAVRNNWLDECCGHMVDGFTLNTYVRKQNILNYLKEIRDNFTTLTINQILIILSGSNELKILKTEGLIEALGLPPVERKEKIDEIIAREEARVETYNPEEVNDEEVESLENTKEEETTKEEEATSSTIDQILSQSSRDESESTIEDVTIDSLANFIKQIDKQVHNRMNDESIEALISIETNKLLNGVLNETITVKEIEDTLSTPTTNEIAKKVTNFVKERFLVNYNGAMSLDLKGYAGNKEPRIMQRMMAHMALSTKSFFNFSLGGVGKTIAAIITSKVIDSKLTIIICLNSTIDQWKIEIMSCYPNSKVFLKNDVNKIKNDSNSKFLVLNYESFQGNQGKRLVKHLIDELNIDFILLDEIHKAKQRDEDKSSNRKETITNLIGLCKQKNENVRVIGMTATPILNNLTEFKYLLEMVMSENFSKDSEDVKNPFISLKTTFNISNAFEMHKHVARTSIRCKLKIPTKFKQKIMNRTANHLADKILFLNDNGSVKRIANGLEYEQIVLNEKLLLVEDQIIKGTIIYSYFTENIINNIKSFVESKGFSVGLYTGEDKSGLDKFKDGKYDVLVASSAIGTGVNGVQEVSSRIIATCLPWTHGELLQLIWRINRQGSKFNDVDLIIPQIYFSYLDEEYSVDKYKLGNINIKKNKSDAAIDGQMAKISAQEEQKLIGLCIDKLNNIFKDHENSIYNIFREKLPITLTDFTFEEFTKIRSELGEISQMHKDWVWRKSENVHNIFKKNPEKFFYYHTLRKEKIKSWSEDPLMIIAKRLKSRPDWVIADFGCGENRLKNEISNKIHAFDHVAVDDSVTACDVSHVPLDNASVDVVVCCLSLWGSNWVDQVKEASRILKPFGRIFIAEKSSRWKDREEELKSKVEAMGFQCFDAMKNTGKFIYLNGEKI